MFLLPWSTGSASEKLLPKDGKAYVGKTPKSPVVRLPLLNSAKRKRESDEVVEKDMAPRPAKGRPKDLNHDQGQPKTTPVVNSAQDSHPDNVKDSSTGAAIDAAPEQPLAKPSQVEVSETSHNEVEQQLQSDQDQSDPDACHESKHTKRPYRKFINAEDPCSVAVLQETIESQFGLEILLKHRELRLIDQEIGKCQIALEQLRRCHLMPYPASSEDTCISPMVSTGTGPTYGSQSRHAPPWGVVDGPYSRHYAQWLIPDPAFGDSEPDILSLRGAGKALPGKSTHGSKAQKGHHSATSRAQRGSARARLQSLPDGHPAPKENKGPMIVKRSTDGRMVKLVCLDCRREDFNSAQGFINHCRIAHSRGFASHDAAAIACGEDVETDSDGCLIGESAGTQSSSGLVHPLIRSTHLTRGKPTVVTSTPEKSDKSDLPGSGQRNSQLDDSSKPLNTPQPALNTPPAGSSSSSPFKPSPQTPHLSALFARSGIGGDLDEMVTEARRQPEPEPPTSDDSEEHESEEEEVAGEVQGHHTLGTRGVIRGGGRLPTQSSMSSTAMGRSPSSKSTHSTMRRKPGHLQTAVTSTYPDHYNHPDSIGSKIGFSSHVEQQNVSPADSLPSINLSPHTIESHPAPSLVSDDGEYDNLHSDSEVPSSAVASDDEDSLNVQVQDHEHHESHKMDIDESCSSSGADFSLGKPHSCAPPPRRGASGGPVQNRVKKAKGTLNRKGGR